MHWNGLVHSFSLSSRLIFSHSLLVQCIGFLEVAIGSIARGPESLPHRLRSKGFTADGRGRGCTGGNLDAPNWNHLMQRQVSPTVGQFDQALELLRRDWIHSILPRDLIVVSGLLFMPQMFPLEILRVDLGWCTGPWRCQTRKYPLHRNFHTLCHPGLWLGGWRPLRCLDAVQCRELKRDVQERHWNRKN